MKTPVLIIIAISLSQLLFAQNDRFIEIAVTETVELKVQDLDLKFKVRAPEIQRKEAIERGDTAEFKICTIQDLRRILLSRYTSAEIVTEPKNPLNQSEGLDSVIVVDGVDSGHYQILLEGIGDRPIDITIVKTTFLSIDFMRKVVVPKMTKKATQEATILASSMQKKIGEVIQCTNILPVEPASPEIDHMNSLLDQLNEGGKPDKNSFSKCRYTVLSYLYRFELID